MKISVSVSWQPSVFNSFTNSNIAIHRLAYRKIQSNFCIRIYACSVYIRSSLFNGNIPPYIADRPINRLSRFIEILQNKSRVGPVGPGQSPAMTWLANSLDRVCGLIKKWNRCVYTIHVSLEPEKKFQVASFRFFTRTEDNFNRARSFSLKYHELSVRSFRFRSLSRCWTLRTIFSAAELKSFGGHFRHLEISKTEISESRIRPSTLSFETCETLGFWDLSRTFETSETSEILELWHSVTLESSEG